jgi:signal transduction histidine kinase
VSEHKLQRSSATASKRHREDPNEPPEIASEIRLEPRPVVKQSLAATEVLPIVAHELGQPLTSALGGAITIKEFPDAEMAQKALLADGVVRNLKHLAALLSNLNAFALIDSGNLTIGRSRVEVRKLFDDFVCDFAGRAERTFEVDCPPALSIAVDPYLFRQVLYNLLSNAKKFSPRGSVIRLEACQDEWGSTLAVSNEGEGFDPEWSEHIFGKAARLSDRPGLGLGLYIAKAIVEAHGGRIWAESGPGMGARFMIALPATTT